eukprot:UN02602
MDQASFSTLYFVPSYIQDALKQQQQQQQQQPSISSPSSSSSSCSSSTKTVHQLSISPKFNSTKTAKYISISS